MEIMNSRLICLIVGVGVSLFSIAAGAFECPRNENEEPIDGFFPDTTNCSRYWQCSLGIAYARHCPDGLHFNPSTNVCDFPGNVNCTSRACPRNVTGITDALMFATRLQAEVGQWMKDDRIDVLSPQVWVLDGATSNTLYEYANEGAVNAENPIVYNLPYTCDGTNNVIYQNALFCNVYNTRYVMKFQLSTRDARLVELPDAGVTPVQDEYTNGGGFMDFAVDENGLWVLFASVADQHEIAIGKLDPVAMNISRVYFTDFVRNLAGNAFMSCGAMYVIDSATDINTYIRYTFDTNTNFQQHLGPNIIPFNHLRHAECDGLYGDITMLEYSNREQKLHVWNCKHLEKYDITFQSN